MIDDHKSVNNHKSRPKFKLTSSLHQRQYIMCGLLKIYSFLHFRKSMIKLENCTYLESDDTLLFETFEST